MPTPRPSDVWLSVNSMSTSRVYHTSTLISQDNSVLIAGGSDGTAAVSSVQKYIPSTGCFQTMRDMSTTRCLHTADQLSSLSGFVLLAGGYDSGNAIVGVADLYHPITADIITIYLSVARYQHTSTIIGRSQLVLIGGYTTGGVMVASSDMLDTSTNSVFQSGTNTMAETHVDHTATFLSNSSDIAFIADGYDSAGAIASTYLYQGSSNSFIPLGSGVTMTPARYCQTATYLASPINKVLLTGGTSSTVNFATMFLFDVASLTLSTLTSTLFYPRYIHTATLLPNGKILIIGGYNGAALRTCELIDPSNNYTVTLASNLTTGRYYHTATLIPDNDNGSVLVCGGYTSPTTFTNTCELYFV